MLCLNALIFFPNSNRIFFTDTNFIGIFEQKTLRLRCFENIFVVLFQSVKIELMKIHRFM